MLRAIMSLSKSLYRFRQQRQNSHLTEVHSHEELDAIPREINSKILQFGLEESLLKWFPRYGVGLDEVPDIQRGLRGLST